MVDTDPESSQAAHSWTLMIGVQDGALDLLRELKNMKMSLEMLQVIDRSSASRRLLVSHPCSLCSAVDQSGNVGERREETEF